VLCGVCCSAVCCVMGVMCCVVCGGVMCCVVCGGVTCSVVGVMCCAVCGGVCRVSSVDVVAV